MTSEIRIYFECLEQAYHYILPLVEKGVKESKEKEVEIKLVRKPKVLRNGSGAIYGIYALTTPDFLITYCINNKEVPIIIGEFSEAVLTEDHELQRAIGGVAAALAGCIYLKISGEKTSSREHGGKKEFKPLTVGKILLERFRYNGFILGDWPTVNSNQNILQRDKDFLSCPPKIELIENIIPLIIKEIINKSDGVLNSNKTICDIVTPELIKLTHFSDYLAKLGAVNGINELIIDWESRKNSKTEPRIFLDKDLMKIKINRFSHAADPERGILIFASTIMCPKTTFVRYVVKNRKEDVLNGFINQASDEGMPSKFLKGLKKVLVDKLQQTNIDITDFLKKERETWVGNKVLSSIFLFSDGISIQGNEDLTLTWKREDIFSIKKGDFFNSLVNFFNMRDYTQPLQIRKDDELNEDDVTYVVVHNILKPNKFEIVFVSYPGAQGGLAVLPEQEFGRKRPRKYLDIIAWLPEKNKQKSSDVAIEESKEIFEKNVVEDIVKRLDSFRTDKTLFSSLSSTLRSTDSTRKLRRIFIGVAFGVKDTLPTTWHPAKVDFIVRIFDKKKWQLAFFGNELKYAFRNMEGEIRLPTVYKVVSNEDARINDIREFLK